MIDRKSTYRTNHFCWSLVLFWLFGVVVAIPAIVSMKCGPPPQCHHLAQLKPPHREGIHEGASYGIISITTPSMTRACLKFYLLQARTPTRLSFVVCMLRESFRKTYAHTTKHYTPQFSELVLKKERETKDRTNLESCIPEGHASQQYLNHFSPSRYSTKIVIAIALFVRNWRSSLGAQM